MRKSGVVAGVLFAILALSITVFVRGCFSHPAVSSAAGPAAPAFQAPAPVASVPDVPVPEPAEEKPVASDSETSSAEEIVLPAALAPETAVSIPVELPAPPSVKVRSVRGLESVGFPVPWWVTDPRRCGPFSIPEKIEIPEAPAPAVSSTEREIEPVVEEPVEETVDVASLFDSLFEEEEEPEYRIKKEETPDDFWDDFFVAGESAVSWVDGTYFLEFYINDEYYGDIESQFISSEIFISMGVFEQYIGDQLIAPVHEKLFADGRPFVSIEELKTLGIDFSFDDAAFVLRATIPYDFLKMRTLSVSRNRFFSGSRYVIDGAVALDPVFFSWVASPSLYGSFVYGPEHDLVENLTLYISNAFLFGDFSVDVPFSVTDITGDKRRMRVGNWVGFKDYPEKSMRLSVGAVGTNYSSRLSGVNIEGSIGFSLEKSYSFGTDRAPGHQFDCVIELYEPSRVKVYIDPVQIFAEVQKSEKPIFDRTLQAGTFRLKDFVFAPGVNRVKIEIIPVSGAQKRTLYRDISYDSNLMAEGDSLWDLSFSVPKGRSSDRKTYSWRDYVNGGWVRYYPKQFNLQFGQRTGLSDALTLSYNLAVTPGAFQTSFSNVWANYLGTSLGSVSIRMDEQDQWPLVSGSLNHRFNKEITGEDINLSFTFSCDGPTKKTGDEESFRAGRLRFSYNFSSRLLFSNMRYSITGGTTYRFSDSAPGWNISASTGVPIAKGLTLSVSAALHADRKNVLRPVSTVNVSGSYSFTPRSTGSTGASWSSDTRKVSISSGILARPGENDNIYMYMSGLEPENWKDHSLQGSWSHTGKKISWTVSQMVHDSYRRYTTNFNFSTSFAFAGGAFAWSSAIQNIFLLVRPEGKLKEGTISIAKSMESQAQLLSTQFGSGLYSSFTPYQKNNIVIYGEGDNSLTSTAPFVYQLTPSARQAYMVRVALADTYTVSARLLKGSGAFYDQYSSPVYRIRDGRMEMDESLYLFSDQEGRFILNDVTPGDYAFDLKSSDGLWYLVKFSVPDYGKKEKRRVITLCDIIDTDLSDEYVDGYDGVINTEIDRLVEENEFWDVIFPEADEVAVENEFVFDDDPFAFLEAPSQVVETVVSP